MSKNTLSLLGHIQITKSEIFSKTEDYVFNKIVDRVIDTNWPAQTKVTFICKAHDTPNTYKVMAVTEEQEINKIEWYIGPTWTKKDLIKYTTSNSLALQNFLKDCVKKIEEANHVVR